MTIQISNLFESTKQITYKKGEIILRPFDTPSGVYYVKQGFVKVYTITESGNENNQLTHKEGELFPLIWALTDKQKSYYYEAINDVIVKRIPKDEFVQALKEDQELLYAMMLQFLSVLDVYQDRIDNLELNKAYERVIGRLLFLAARFGVSEGNKVSITLPLSHKDLASSINMTRETASYEMNKLEKKRLITLKRSFLTITDVTKLKEELKRA